MVTTLGKNCFYAYWEVMDPNFNKTPNWHDLSNGEKEAWEAVGYSVLQSLGGGNT